MRFILLGLLGCLFAKPSYIRTIKFSGAAQGTSYHITYYAADTLVTKLQIDSILMVIDSSLSLYRPHSLINQFNRSSSGIVADEHLIKVFKRARQIFKMTGGLFDLTVFPLTDAWGFGPARHETVPDSSVISERLACVDMRLLALKGRRIVKKKPCVQLDPNGIAQGYSVDVLAGFFETKGVQNYLIELGGEIRVKGRKPGHEKISVGIEAPGEDADFSMIEKVVFLEQGAITTSGNYRRFYQNNGQVISHLLNPKTGHPLQNELISVTIYGKDAITADGLDNAVMAMGLVKGLAFIESNKDLAGYFIYRLPGGAVADTMSSRFKLLLQP